MSLATSPEFYIPSVNVLQLIAEFRAEASVECFAPPTKVYLYRSVITGHSNFHPAFCNQFTATLSILLTIIQHKQKGVDNRHHFMDAFRNSDPWPQLLLPGAVQTLADPSLYALFQSAGCDLRSVPKT